MSVGIWRQNIMILFWNYGGCTVSFLGIHEWEQDNLYWILTGPSFAVYYASLQSVPSSPRHPVSETNQ